MAKVKNTGSSSSRQTRKAVGTEARENQLIALAVDLAEQQLRDGTASSQVISHYLKLSTAKYELEKEKLIEENKLLRAKTQTLENDAKSKEDYEKVIKAIQIYSGHGDADDY